MAAAVLLIITRPRLLGLDRWSLWAAFLLGAALATVSAAHFAAVSRIPLGLAATITFLGPFSVAVFASRGWRTLAFSLLAGVGILLSLDPWSQGANEGWSADPVGLLLAGVAALGFAAYILLTRRVGQMFSGTDGLTISLLTAAILLTPFGFAGMQEVPSLHVVIGAAALAILSQGREGGAGILPDGFCRDYRGDRAGQVGDRIEKLGLLKSQGQPAWETPAFSNSCR